MLAKVPFASIVVVIATLSELLICHGRDLQVTIASDPFPVKVTYYQPDKNLNAYTLILDVNSLYFKGNHPYFYGMQGPDTDTVEKCAVRCAGVAGCNAFVSCPRKEGCGSGCKNWVKTHPALTSPKQGLDNYVSNKLPLTGFGEWTYPHYGLDGCANTTALSNTTTNDKWGWGLCSLKKIPVAQTAAPKFFISKPGSLQTGFVSGILAKPANCPQGVPYMVCAQCNKLKAAANRALCMGCAKALSPDNPVLEATLVPGTGALTYDYCPRCFKKDLDSKKCISCLKAKNKSRKGYDCLS